MKFTAHIITGALLLATPVAFAQSANANASATIITSLSLVNTTPLSFGAIVPGSSAGTVVVSPTDGTRTLSGVTSGRFIHGDRNGKPVLYHHAAEQYQHLR